VTSFFHRIPAGWWRIQWRDPAKNKAPWEIGEPGRRFKDSLPPERPFLVSVFLMIVDGVLLVSAFGFLVLVGSAILAACCHSCCSVCDYDGAIYLIPAFLFVTTAVDRILRHRRKVYEARLEDRSEVERLFLHPALTQGQSSSIISHLKKIGPEGWTEYQVLPLRQLIIEKAPPEELIPMARTILTDLKEYSEDTSYSYDTDLYYDWKSKIDLAIADYERNRSLGSDAEKALRAVISGATEHVTDYEMKWVEGSNLVRSLLTVVSVGSIVLLYCGLLPLICPTMMFNIFNWVVLGAVGALMGVLQNLRSSDVTEVGNTEGRKEIWRTVSGGTLGLIGGALAYAGIAAHVLGSGSLVPILDGHELVDLGNLGKAIIWAIAAGFLVDRIIERVLSPLKSE
jgi:hypothetical protein